MTDFSRLVLLTFVGIALFIWLILPGSFFAPESLQQAPVDETYAAPIPCSGAQSRRLVDGDTNALTDQCIGTSNGQRTVDACPPGFSLEIRPGHDRCRQFRPASQATFNLS